MTEHFVRISYFGRYGPFSTLKNGFRSITFENISVLDSYFIHEHIIIKYRSSLIKGKSHQLFFGVMALFQC